MSNTLRQATLDEMRDCVRKLRAAETREAVGAVCAEMIGYDTAAEDPAAGLDELRADALDYVREVCFAHQIHCSEAGL